MGKTFLLIKDICKKEREREKGKAQIVTSVPELYHLLNPHPWVVEGGGWNETTDVRAARHPGPVSCRALLWNVRTSPVGLAEVQVQMSRCEWGWAWPSLTSSWGCPSRWSIYIFNTKSLVYNNPLYCFWNSSINLKLPQNKIFLKL